MALANAQKRRTPEQFQALVAGLSTPAADDADFRRVWTTILPIYFNKYDPEIAAIMDEATLYCAGAYNQGMGKLLPGFNVLSHLSEITVPTLVITGRHDWITPPAQ